jgi:hypothetical protein
MVFDGNHMQALLLCSFFLISRAAGLPAPSPADPAPSFSVELGRNPNYAPDGLAAYTSALLKWGIDLPEHLATAVSMKGSGGWSAFSQNHAAKSLLVLACPETVTAAGPPISLLAPSLLTMLLQLVVFLRSTKPTIASGSVR